LLAGSVKPPDASVVIKKLQSTLLISTDFHIKKWAQIELALIVTELDNQRLQIKLHEV